MFNNNIQILIFQYVNYLDYTLIFDIVLALIHTQHVLIQASKLILSELLYF